MGSEPQPAWLKEWAYAGFAIDLGLGGGHRRALGALVLLLAPPAGHAGERLTAHRRLLRS
jgi:hypothetical protein